MATAIPYKSQLRLYFVVGENEQGEEIYKSKLFNNIKVEASADELYAVATALAPLQIHPLDKVERGETAEITG